MKHLFIFLFSIFVLSSFSQDTITVMQYNLLGYSTTYLSCNTSNNSLNTKDINLIKILQYVKPDVFTVNEMGTASGMADRVLNNCLNTGGITHYSRATLTNYTAYVTITNMMYYNNQKFTLESQDVILGASKDINVYKLKYKTLDPSGSPIYLKCIVAHLKAGSDPDDIAYRVEESNKIMNYIAGLTDVENILLMGDFNIYSSSEQAFTNFVNAAQSQYKLSDPAGSNYPWSAGYHTQSTHADNNGCAASGGMDDRFDFILSSTPIMHSTKRVYYIPNTYKAVGQDGQHYDKSINDGINYVVSAELADALYTVSDHLPVTMKIRIDPYTSINTLSFSGIEFYFNNPANNNLEITINKTLSTDEQYKLEIINLFGQNIYKSNIELINSENKFLLDISGISKGLYFVNIIDSNNNRVSRKLICN